MGHIEELRDFENVKECDSYLQLKLNKNIGFFFYKKLSAKILLMPVVISRCAWGSKWNYMIECIELFVNCIVHPWHVLTLPSLWRWMQVLLHFHVFHKHSGSPNKAKKKMREISDKEVLLLTYLLLHQRSLCSVLALYYMAVQ